MNHALVIRPNVEEQHLEIFRGQEQGKPVLYTHVNLRSDNGSARPFQEVAVQLGECLLFAIDMARDLP